MSTDRTMVRNAVPSCISIAASAFFCSDASDAFAALNTTLPLERTVFTSEKPAASKACCSSGIFAFMGMTPLRKAAYRGMGSKGARGARGPQGPQGANCSSLEDLEDLEDLEHLSSAVTA